MTKDGTEDDELNNEQDEEEEEENAFEDPSAQDVSKLAQALNRIRKMYSNTIMTGEGDRLAFETLLNEVDTIVSQNEQKRMNEIDMLRTDLLISNGERDMKIKDWRNRYTKLQERWSECITNLDQLQEEKEALRKQRDNLLLNRSSQGRASTPSSSSDNSSVNERRALFLALLKSMLEALVISLNAVTATLFIHNPKEKELESLVIVCPPAIDDEFIDDELMKRIPSVVRVSARDSKSLASACFNSGDFLNVLDVQKDDRFFKNVDQKTGFTTKFLLCFPIFSPSHDSVVGVIEVINKRNNEIVFSVQDEARLAEFTMIIGRMLETPGLKEIGFDTTILGLSTNSTPDAEESAEPNKNSLKRMTSFLEVKRTKLKSTRPPTVNSPDNHAEFIMNDNVSAVQGKPQSLVPKDIDNYIKKLEMCWRKAVGESAQLQNRVVQLEKDLYSKQSLKFNTEKNTLELNNRIMSLERELLKLTHDFSQQKEKWTKKETELKNELEMTQKTNQKLLIEHAKMGNEEIIKNIIVPSNGVNRTIQLPYIDLKSQKKKIVLNLNNKTSRNRS